MFLSIYFKKLYKPSDYYFLTQQKNIAKGILSYYDLKLSKDEINLFSINHLNETLDKNNYVLFFSVLLYRTEQLLLIIDSSERMKQIDIKKEQLYNDFRKKHGVFKKNKHKSHYSLMRNKGYLKKHLSNNQKFFKKIINANEVLDINLIEDLKIYLENNIKEILNDYDFKKRVADDYVSIYNLNYCRIIILENI